MTHEEHELRQKLAGLYYKLGYEVNRITDVQVAIGRGKSALAIDLLSEVIFDLNKLMEKCE